MFCRLCVAAPGRLCARGGRREARRLFGASYIGTDAKGDCGAGESYCFSNGNGAMDNKRRHAGRSTVVVSVGNMF